MAIPKVTYLFGAGASAYCLPTIETLKSTMSSLESKIVTLIRNQYDIAPLTDGFWEADIGKLNEYRVFLEHLIWLRTNCEKHKTPDTLAKHFFLTGGENSSELSKLKLTLSAVFTLLQCSNPFGDPERQYPDMRYDSLLMGLLKGSQDQLHIPEHIKFLSWNYDLQFELAAMKHFGSSDIIETQLKLKITPTIVNLTAGNLPSLVHLNGVAGMYEYDNNKTNHLYRKIGKEWTE